MLTATAVIAALLTIVALAGGAWLTMMSIVLIIDAAAAFDVGDARNGIASVRLGLASAWTGLFLFFAGAMTIARMLL